jgi:hypothetical protein
MQSGKLVVLAGIIVAMCTAVAATQSDDPAKKLGILVGKWHTEGMFTGTVKKVSSNLECRWSPQGNYLVCEQAVTGADPHLQLTIYSYNSREGNYSCTTFRNPGATPATGTVSINGKLWTYSISFEADGKKREVRTTNDFSSPGQELFKTEMSDDGGAHWKTVAEGKASRVAD